MKRTQQLTVAVAAATLSVCASAQADSPWATRYTDYLPGTLNTGAGSSFNDPTQALGVLDQNVSNGSQSTAVVQLGQRGSIVLGFDHSITNNRADASNAGNPTGFDFTIYGNAFTAGANVYREPGFVEVAQDVNGSPGTWYLLLPEKLPSAMVVGTDTGTGSSLLYGYADEHPVNYQGDVSLATDVTGSAGGDGFKLEWAVLESSSGVPLLDGSGNPTFVTLNSIDWIRITDVLPSDGQFATGAITTDIDAVYDLVGTPVPEPVTIMLLPAAMLLRRRRQR